MNEKVKGFGGCVMQIFFFGISTIQLYAVLSFAHGIWGWSWFGSAVFAALLSYIPILGSIAGIYCAIYAWGWPWWGACLLFFWPIIFAVLFASIGTLWEKASTRP